MAVLSRDTETSKADLAPSLRDRAQAWLPKLVLSPSFAVILLFVYGFILFTGLSILHRQSKILPTFGL